MVLAAEIGFGLTAFGMFFTFLGVLLFFDQALLAMGNVRSLRSLLCALSARGSRVYRSACCVPAQLMFLIGITLTIGTSHVMSFFLARKKLRGTCTFFVGMGLVMYGWPVIGILVEGFGFMNLFWCARSALSAPRAAPARRRGWADTARASAGISSRSR